MKLSSSEVWKCDDCGTTWKTGDPTFLSNGRGASKAPWSLGKLPNHSKMIHYHYPAGGWYNAHLIEPAPQPSIPSHLTHLIPTLENAVKLREKIISNLQYLRLSKRLDLENLAHEIFLNAWENKRPLTSTFIRHRAFNAIRDLKSEIEFIEVFAPPAPQVDSPNPRREQLNSALTLAGLTQEEMTLIYLKFYQGNSLEQIAASWLKSLDYVERLHQRLLSRLRSAGRILENGGEV